METRQEIGLATFEAAKAGCRDSQEQIVRRHIRLVEHMKRRVVNVGYIDDDEATSAGMIGLYKSIFAYDPTRAKFSTFAGRYIWGSIMDAKQREFAQTKHHVSITETVDRLMCSRDVPPYEEDNEKINKAISTLHYRDADILRRLYGITPYLERQTLKAVGNIYGISKERVRQIEVRSLKILKRKYTREQFSL